MSESDNPDDETIGGDSSLLLRPLRPLLAEGKPPGDVKLVVARLGDQLTPPIGALFASDKRICFWPAYPVGTDMTKELDHATLEVESGTTHVTGVNAAGKTYRRRGKHTKWRLYQFPHSAYALWFPLLIRWETIQGQEKQVKRKIKWPNEIERDRRMQELDEYHTRLQNPIIVPIHPSQTEAPNCLLLQVYVLRDPNKPDEFLEGMFPTDYAIGAVKGWKPLDDFAVQAVKLGFGPHKFSFAVACPPGEMVAAVWLGMAKKHPTPPRKSTD